MSSKALGKRPEPIEMSKKTRTLAPQQSAGPRKLVIKNLRISRDTTALDEYFARTWAELDAALTAIFASKNPQMPFERIYKGTEDICRRGEAEKLANLLATRCKQYLEGEVYESIKRGGFSAADDNIALIRNVLEYWKTWSKQLRLLRSAFAYLDRSYLLNLKGKESAQINDMGIRTFKVAMFGASRHLKEGSPGARVISAVCELVDHDRTGDDRFDSNLLKDAIAMLRILGIYSTVLEPRFLAESNAFFEGFARDRSENYSLKDYIMSCENLLNRENQRSDTYNFDSSTKRLLLDDAHKVLIEKYSFKLLNSGSVSRLLDDNDVESMKALYELLKLSQIQKKLKGPWQEYIERVGESIAGDVDRGDEMIVRLLLLRRSLDVIVRDAFAADETFTYGLREAFAQFINSKAVNSKWNTGTSKVGEMIAKYIDMLLRGGLKTLPASLLSDKKDRDAAEKSGVASTADEDAELDRQLDSAIDIFRFIDGKDVFEAFYKRDLARRLLMGRSASQDAERNMIAKLKSECGSSFTNNLEQMFRDQAIAKEEMDMYKAWLEGSGRAAAKLDLNVTILAEAAWPNYPDVQVLLPKEVLTQVELFEAYYYNRQSGRKLKWKHNMAHAVVSARFKKGVKELMVSAFQAVVLVLFNEVDGEDQDGVLSYRQIADASGLVDRELQRTLQSLACGKVRVLTKHPKGREVSTTDTFTVNKTFWDPKFRVKINQIQLKETTEENKATHERVVADRQFETQAAIVRIMKARKTMPHAQLVAEVIGQTRSRGAMDPQQIKVNIEKLIEKDYLERDGTSYSYLA